MTHICVGKTTIIGSDNGLSPGRRQAIILTNAGILLIGILGTSFSENLKRNSYMFSQENAFENVCEMASILWRPQWVNSSPPSAAYMHRWTGSALVQIMACLLDGAKPLSEPMLIYCQLDPGNLFQWNFIWNSNIFSQENAFECHLRNGGHFVQGEMS